MTSIYDIPYKDIEIFLIANKKNSEKSSLITQNYESKNDAYDKVLILLKNKKSKGHTINIIEWMMAYNLLKNKVNIPNYTIYELNKLSQDEIDQLAKLLTMNSDNIEHIKNILRYLHKLDENVNIGTNKELTIAGEEIYNIILNNLDNKSINRMNINKYSKLSLEDQKFWSNRLNDLFNLKTKDKLFDYKFTVQFLDNGKSFEENYHEAMNKGLKLIIKLLLENKVVDEIKPDNLLQNIRTTLPDLGENKNLPYNDFIKIIIEQTNEVYQDDEDYIPIDISFFDKIEYTGKEFKVILNVENLTDENMDETTKTTKTTFDSNGGITNGEILYKIAQLIPNDEEIRKINLKYIKDYPKEILKNIEFNRDRYIKATKKSKGKYNDYNQEVSKEFLEELIKSPEEFLDFLDKNAINKMHAMINPKNLTNDHYYDFLPNFDDFFGNHIYWEGLRKWEGEDEYHVQLGS
jgi:hypothetical protein